MKQTIHVPLYTIRHGKIGGTEFAIYNLVRGLAAIDCHVMLSYGRTTDLSADFLLWAQRQDSITLHCEGGVPGPKAVRFLEETLYRQRDRRNEWTLFPNYFLPPSIVGRGGRNCVILHDIQYKRYPQYHSKKRREWLDFYLPKMFSVADLVILISHSELELVREYFGEAAGARCAVVHNAIDFDRLSGRENPGNGVVDHPYILSVCHQFPHKNVSTLLSAFSEVAAGNPDIHLYMVGSASEANQVFLHSTLAENLRGRVHLTGFVSDTELGRLYAGAKIFVLPSLYEGFGMPAVEALGLGVPTLVSNAYALPEVTLGYAGLIDDPLDTHAWASAIEDALRSGSRPPAEQVAHIRATYSPAVIAQRLLSILGSHG